MRTRNEALREQILDAAEALAHDAGASALSMRAIAAAAGVAPGTVYLYYANKQAVLTALAARFWQSVLAQLGALPAGSFAEFVPAAYAVLQGGMRHFRGGMLAALRAGDADARTRALGAEAQLHGALQTLLVQRLAADGSIPPERWDACFTPDALAGFVLQHLLALLGTGGKPDFLAQVCRELLYQHKQGG